MKLRKTSDKCAYSRRMQREGRAYRVERRLPPSQPGPSDKALTFLDVTAGQQQHRVSAAEAGPLAWPGKGHLSLVFWKQSVNVTESENLPRSPHGNRTLPSTSATRQGSSVTFLAWKFLCKQDCGLANLEYAWHVLTQD